MSGGPPAAGAGIDITPNVGVLGFGLISPAVPFVDGSQVLVPVAFRFLSNLWTLLGVVANTVSDFGGQLQAFGVDIANLDQAVANLGATVSNFGIQLQGIHVAIADIEATVTSLSSNVSNLDNQLAIVINRINAAGIP